MKRIEIDIPEDDTKNLTASLRILTGVVYRIVDNDPHNVCRELNLHDLKTVTELLNLEDDKNKAKREGYITH